MGNACRPQDAADIVIASQCAGCECEEELQELHLERALDAFRKRSEEREDPLGGRKRHADEGPDDPVSNAIHRLVFIARKPWPQQTMDVVTNRWYKDGGMALVMDEYFKFHMTRPEGELVRMGLTFHQMEEVRHELEMSNEVQYLIEEKIRESMPAGAKEEVDDAWIQEILSDDRKYASWSSLKAAIDDRGVVLLRGDWITKRGSTQMGHLLPKRQDLPHEACWQVEPFVSRLGDPLSHAIAVVSISYCWHSPSHPDPAGEQLQLIAALVKAFAGTHGGCTWHGEIGKRTRDVFDDLWKPVEGPDDVAIFIDWCSLYQKPRTHTQEDEFTKALMDIEIWYAHRGTHVWMLTAVPHVMKAMSQAAASNADLDCNDGEPLMVQVREKQAAAHDCPGCGGSGKCKHCCGQGAKICGSGTHGCKYCGGSGFFEAFAGGEVTTEDTLIKGSGVCHTCNGKGCTKEQQAHRIQAEKESLYSSRGWPTFECCVSTLMKDPDMVLDMGKLPPLWRGWTDVTKACGTSREPPKNPASFAKDVRLKAFTVPRDCSMLVEKYGKAYNTAICKANEIVFSDVTWHLHQLTEIGALLPQSFHLESLQCYSCPLDDEGGQILAKAALACPTLVSLRLWENMLGDLTAQALGAALPKCRNLRHLCLHMNSIGDVGAAALAHALPKSDLTVLRLDENVICDKGALSLLAALPACHRLQCFIVRGNAITAESADALRAAWHLTGKEAGSLARIWPKLPGKEKRFYDPVTLEAYGGIIL